MDELMELAAAALGRQAWLEAARVAYEALGLAREHSDFELMAKVVEPLAEARRRRLEKALDVRKIQIVDTALPEGKKLKRGCYLVQPPLVGADARQLRLTALAADVPVAVVCREPLTLTRMWPIVAIGPGATVRLPIQPPDDQENPDLAWFVKALEALGDWAIESLDPGLEPVRRVDKLLDRVETVADHQRLHECLRDACLEAHKALADDPGSSRPSEARVQA